MKILRTNVTVAALLCAAATCLGDDPKTISRQTDPPSAQEQMVRLIMPFEIARRHAELWETNSAAETLVKQMMGDLVDDPGLDVRWTSRFILQEDRKQEADAFEKEAIAKLQSANGDRRFEWNADRVLAAILASRSCVNCHAVKPGDTIGFISLRLSRRGGN